MSKRRKAAEGVRRTLQIELDRLQKKIQAADELIDLITETHLTLIESGIAPPFRAKSVLRRKALEQRDNLHKSTRAVMASRLKDYGCDLIAKVLSPVSKPVIALYSPIGSEPDILPLAKALEARGFPLALPVDLKSGAPLVFRRWTPSDALATGAFGIKEPLQGSDEVEPEMWFIPLISYDRSGRRFGYGAGNVDRTLKYFRSRKRLVSIGVSFSALEEQLVPVEVQDEPIDAIITETETIWIRR